MSIIRQRRKNLIVSGVLGFMIGALIITGAAYVLRQPLANRLNISPEVQVEVPERAAAIVAAKPIAKGSIIDEGDVMSMMVEAEGKVMDHFSDVTDLIGKKAVIDIDKNMPLTLPMFVDDRLILQNLRLYEVSFVELPYHLAVGDTVDVRIAFPTGQEYVVLSKKTVKGYERRVKNIHSGLLTVALEEEEALRMSSALVDMYLAEGARVYMVKYVDSDNQLAATVNYPVNESVRQLIKDNPNILASSDLEAIVIARSSLNTALSEILDANYEPVVKVDMTTPDMSAGLSIGSEDTASQNQTQTPSAETTVPMPMDTSQDISPKSVPDTGIGF